MKNFHSKILFLFIIFILSGCSKCPHSRNDFTAELETFNKVKEIILQHTPEKAKQYKKETVQQLIDKEDFEILDALYLDHIYKIRSVLVFAFKHPYKKNWLDKKAQQNLESCNTYLFCSEDVEEREYIMSYAQYAECRYKKEDINNNWTYVFQKWYCAD